MTREEICRNCRMLPSIHHLEYPSCKQPMGPINEEERRKLGTNPGDMVTGESIKKAAEIAIQPYCLKRMIAGGYFDGIEANRRAHESRVFAAGKCEDRCGKP